MSQLRTLDQISENSVCKRKFPRFGVSFQCNWDFFSTTSGVKPGFMENISLSGCLLRTLDPIDHRRWIRLVIKSDSGRLWLTALGRVIRRQDIIESWNGELTLHRFGIEFTKVLDQNAFNILVPGTPCASCGQDMLCHIRKSCRSLLVQDGLA